MTRNNYPVELFSASGTVRLRPNRGATSSITEVKAFITVGSQSNE